MIAPGPSSQAPHITCIAITETANPAIEPASVPAKLGAKPQFSAANEGPTIINAPPTPTVAAPTPTPTSRFSPLGLAKRAAVKAPPTSVVPPTTAVVYLN